MTFSNNYIFSVIPLGGRAMLQTFSYPPPCFGCQDIIKIGVNEILYNSPNPFNPSTKIHFSVKKEGNVKVSIFNTLGKNIATLVEEFKNPGDYSVNFDGSNLSSGVYFSKLETIDGTTIKKITLLK